MVLTIYTYWMREVGMQLRNGNIAMSSHFICVDICV